MDKVVGVRVSEIMGDFGCVTSWDSTNDEGGRDDDVKWECDDVMGG